MTKIRLVLAYDGTDFHGFARQSDLRTVQGVMESVLEKVTGSRVEVFGSGRTDRGVHARGQVVHWVQAIGPPAERYVYVLRRSLPPDIVPVRADEVSDAFHARFSALRKTYRYTLQCARVEDVFTKRYAWHVPDRLDLDSMYHAARHLHGYHDFTSFCAASTPVDDKRREIFDLHVERQGSYFHVYCTGSGFLQNMVRIIVGTLVDVGLGRIDAAGIPAILQARDRTKAGRTAPPQGLALWEVLYDDVYGVGPDPDGRDGIGSHFPS